MFASGCEFLICRRERHGNVVHVYLREVEFGIGNQVVLWVDDKARDFKFFKHRMWMRIKQQDDHFNHFNKYVIKSNNFTAEAYLRSNLFQFLIRQCQSFKIIQCLRRTHHIEYKKQAVLSKLSPDLKSMQMCIQLLMNIFEILADSCDQDSINKIRYAFHQHDELPIEESIKRDIINFI